jgi:hypothetical protein
VDSIIVLKRLLTKEFVSNHIFILFIDIYYFDKISINYIIATYSSIYGSEDKSKVLQFQLTSLKTFLHRENNLIKQVTIIYPKPSNIECEGKLRITNVDI